MKATSLLESQHRQAFALIDDLEKPGANSKELSERLATALLGHMVIEGEVFYRSPRSSIASSCSTTTRRTRFRS